MERPGTGLGSKGGNVGSGYACTNQNLHLLPGSFHQLPQQGSALRGACGLSAGQDGGKPQLLCGFQRGKGVAADIKGAVQGAVHGAVCFFCRLPGCGIDGAQSVCVQRSRRGQHAGHDAVRTGGYQLGGAFGHLCQLVAVVAEIAKAGPQQCPHRQAGLSLDLTQQGRGRSGAADDQVGAQLQPISAAAFCRQCAGGAVYANFQSAVHSDTSIYKKRF